MNPQTGRVLSHHPPIRAPNWYPALDKQTCFLSCLSSWLSEALQWQRACSAAPQPIITFYIFLLHGTITSNTSNVSSRCWMIAYPGQVFPLAHDLFYVSKSVKFWMTYSFCLSRHLLAAEQRVRLSTNERRREYNEERRNEYENYLEEDRDGKTWMWLLSCFSLGFVSPEIEETPKCSNGKI